MYHIKSKSALVVFLMMLWSLLAGCAFQTYEQLEAEYKVTGDSTKLERRDAQLERAEAYFIMQAQCNASEKHVGMCTRMYSGTQIKRRRNPEEYRSIDDTIREWKLQVMNGCGCATQADLRRFRKDMERQGFGGQ